MDELAAANSSANPATANATATAFTSNGQKKTKQAPSRSSIPTSRMHSTLAHYNNQLNYDHLMSSSPKVAPSGGKNNVSGIILASQEIPSSS